MKRLLMLVGLAMAMASCTGDTAFPTPTGKGVVRAINAIKGSPEIAFLIEERTIDTLGYKFGSAPARWDDFQYTFNFDVFFLGNTATSRVASQVLKVDADREYTFLLTGAATSPAVTIWERDERTFAGTETVFEARFAHTAATLGSIDVYFAAAGTPPAIGEERGSLSFGDILDPLDIEAGDYVLTITTAGDPSDIVYESSTISYGSQNAFIIPIFDGDETDAAPYNVRLLSATGGLTSLPDVRFPPTVRFIQASQDLPPSDVYDDEMLMNQVLSNHAFGDITGDIDVPVGTIDYTYTAVGSTGATQFEGSLTALAGAHFNFVVFGDNSARVASTYNPDRRSISTAAKLRFLHTAINHDFVDLYVLDAGESIDDATRVQTLAYSLITLNILFEAGSYDLYVTTLDEKTVLSGPLNVDLVLGDSVELIILDTVDPATAELKLIPAP